MKSTLFPPWFVPRGVFRKIEQLLPSIYHQRFALYFRKHGCVRCKKQNYLYGANGLCLHCLGLINDRLKQIDRQMKRKEQGKKRQTASRFAHSVAAARALLRDMKPRRSC
jgi:hypothetical protein